MSWTDDLLYLAKQSVAGTADGVALPFALEGAIRGLRGEGLDNPGTQRVAGISNSINELLGIRDPETVTQRIVRAIGVPVVGVPSLAAKAPNAIRAGADLAMSVLLPGTVGPTVKNVATKAAITGAVSEGLHQGVDAIMSPAQAAPAKQQAYDIDSGLQQTYDIDQGLQTPMPVAKPQVPQFDIDSGVDANVNSIAEHNEKNRMAGYLVGGLVAGALALGSAQTIKYAMGKAVNPTGGINPNLPNDVDRTPLTGKGARASQYVTDQYAPLISTVKELHGPDIAKDFEARIRTHSGLSVQSMFENTMRTGQLPDNLGTLAHNPADLLNNVGVLKQADPQSYQRLIDGLHAADALDDRAIANRLGNHGARPSQWDLDSSQLRQQVTDLTNDPALAPIVEQYRSIMNGMLDYTAKRGVISRAQYQMWVGPNGEHKNYVPKIASQDQPSMTDKFMNKIMTPTDTKLYDETRFMWERQYKNMQGVRNPTDPFDAMGQYVESVIGFAEHNALRRDYIQMMRSTPEGKRVFRDTDAGQMGNISYRHNGNLVSYNLTDPFIESALSFSPATVNTATTALRQVATSMITGKWNPFFAPTAALYDTYAAMLMKPGKSMMPDFTFPIKAVVNGMFPAIKSTIAGEISQTLNTFLATNRGGLMGLPRSTVQMIANNATDAYENSITTLAKQYGGLPGRFLNPPVLNPKEVLGQLAPKFGNDYQVFSSLSRIYGGVIDAIHNGPKLAYVAEKYKPGMTSAQVTRLMAEAKDIGGDLTRKGAATSGPVSWLINDAPYGNTTVQTWSKLMRFAKENPQQFIPRFLMLGPIPMATGALVMSQLSEAHRDYYWNQVDPQIRATHIPVPDVSDPQKTYWIPMLPELAALSSATLPMLNALFNISGGQHEGLPEMKAALNKALGISLPVPMAGLSNVLGKNTQLEPTNMLFGDSPLKAIPQGEDLPGQLIGAQGTALVKSVFGTVGGLAVKLANMEQAALRQKREPHEQLTVLAREAAHDIGQQTKPINMLWQDQHAMNKQHRFSDEYREKREALDKIAKVWQQSVMNPYEPGSKIRTGLPGGPLPTVTDPVAQAILSTLQSAAVRVNQNYSGQISALNKQINSLNFDTTLKPNERVAKRNELLSGKADYERLYVEELKQAEQLISQQVGKPFKIESFDPSPFLQ